jgi:hypothetical protein
MRSINLAAIICMAAFAAIAVEWTCCANARSEPGEAQAEYRTASMPRVAVIALAQQRISVYGAAGKIMEASVSTGAPGYETPAGIYSILDKEEEHHSNLYDDASMPFMQRLTWSGIAMHAGALPGYPDSHGCARLPYGFASQLYQATKLGMRVIVVREDITPADIEQPDIFSQASETSPAEMRGWPNETEMPAHLQAIKEAKQEEAEAAKEQEQKARSVAQKKAAEVGSASLLAKAAEANLARMEAELNGSELPETVFNRIVKGEAARAKAGSRVEAARLRLEAARAQVQAKMNVARRAEEEAQAAAGSSKEAAEAAELARQNAWPISIFISRKTQRLYIRRGRAPVFESPVTIRDPEKPIGTFVFIALSYAETSGHMRWNAVSMYENATEIEPHSGAKHKLKRHLPAKPTDVVGARNALGRLVIPQEAVDQISKSQLPGASLIISDEGLSDETGQDTDFIVFMSGEPQGGSTSRAARVTEQDVPGASKQLQAQKKRAGSSFSRSRLGPDGGVWRSRGFSPFAELFGY